ncbi:MAG: peptide chain release factor N(5)-glutamine methyltransferase [Fimbriimonadaceae bacterium]|nr:peptide chain release factor N(5)-glutamine methyltransferase [Chitinophagales bacterium]
MQTSEAIKIITASIINIYDEREAGNIARYLIEEKYGKQYVRENIILNDEQADQIKSIIERLRIHEPIQYIIGEAWFYGLKYKVNNDVLIPRPETEELVELIIKENNSGDNKILDIGSGSGCIAITLKKHLPASQIISIDISEQALQIAKLNATIHNTEIQFIKANILNANGMNLSEFTLIVSNPPYVDPAEKNTLQKNVLDFEPHLALFGNAGDPFIFYKKICAFAKTKLINNGKLYFEIPENRGAEIASILQKNNFIDISIKKDMQQKERIVSGVHK